MFDNKKKILVGAIIVALVIIFGAAYFFMQNNSDEDFFSNSETFNNEAENIQNDNNNVINNEEGNNVIQEDKIVVHVAGCVISPGVISLKEGARIIDAIDEAGGVTEDADLSKINLAYVLSDAQKIYIPSVNEKKEENFVIEGSGEAVQLNNGEGNTKTDEKIMVNINTANENELQKIPGIGATIAKRIVAYRKENGKFTIIEDLQKVSGIGTSKFDKIKSYICVK